MKQYLDKYGLRILTSAIVFATFLLLDTLRISIGDDLGYLFTDARLHDGSGHRITTLWECISTQGMHYFTTNGRFVVHTIVHIFTALAPEWLFLAVNSLMFTLLWGLTRQLSGSRGAGITALFMLWLLLPVPAVTMLSLTAYAVNYLWTGVAILFWYKLWIRESDRVPGNVELTCLALYSILVGSLHEGYSLPIAGAIYLLILFRRIRLTERRIYMLFPFTIGMILEVAAPGNFTRIDSGGGMNFNVIGHKALLVVQESALTGVGVMTIVLLALATFRRSVLRRVASSYSILLLAVALSLCMAALTYTSMRQLFPAALFSIIVLVNILNRIFRKYVFTGNRKQAFLGVLYVIGLLIFVSATVPVYQMRSKNKAIYDAFIESLQQSVSQGDDTAFAPGERSERVEGFSSRYNNDVLSRQWISLPFDGYTKRGLSRKYADGNAHALRHIVPFSREYILSRSKELPQVKRPFIYAPAVAMKNGYSLVSVPSEERGVPYRSAEDSRHLPWEEFEEGGRRYLIIPERVDKIVLR